VRGKHYYSSKNTHPDFKAETLRKIDKKIVESMDKDYIISDEVFQTDSQKESKAKKKTRKKKNGN